MGISLKTGICWDIFCRRNDLLGDAAVMLYLSWSTLGSLSFLAIVILDGNFSQAKRGLTGKAVDMKELASLTQKGGTPIIGLLLFT